MSFNSPNLWSENSNDVQSDTNQTLKKYHHLLKWGKEESILEFGFAGGKNSVETLGKILPNDYKEFFGTDLNENMINYAKEHCKLPKSHFFTMDIGADAIPKELENRFDHIFGISVMHLVKNPQQAFTNIYKMLKPNGTLFTTFFERIPNDPAFDALSKHPIWSKYNQEDMLSTYHHSTNPEKSYRNDLDKAGFKNYVFAIEKRVHRFSSEEKFRKLTIAINPIVSKIPDELRDDYIKCYLEETYRSPNVCVEEENGERIVKIKYTVFVVCATKEGVLKKKD